MTRDMLQSEEGLRTEREIGRVRLKAYYDVLTKDEEFRRELMKLIGSISLDDRKEMYPSGACYRVLDSFATAWCLPTDEGILQLWECVRAGDRAEPWRWLTPEIDLGDGVEVGTVEIDGNGEAFFQLREGLDPETLEPRIVPPALPAITYDPTVESGASIRVRLSDIANRMMRSMIEQVERIEDDAKASGRRALPPRLGAKDRDRMARRLYRRTRGMRPSEIADLEEQELPDEVVNAENVRQTVAEWARSLRIALPQLPRGRPLRP